MKEKFVKCTLEPEFWNEKQETLKRIALGRGVMYTPQPIPVHYLGNIFHFDPECELPARIGRILGEKRWYIKVVGEPYEKQDVAVELPTDARDEDIYKFGEVYLCKYCGWPFPKKASRSTHERMWCKRKGE